MEFNNKVNIDKQFVLASFEEFKQMVSDGIIKLEADGDSKDITYNGLRAIVLKYRDAFSVTMYNNIGDIEVNALYLDIKETEGVFSIRTYHVYSFEQTEFKFMGIETSYIIGVDNTYRLEDDKLVSVRKYHHSFTSKLNDKTVSGSGDTFYRSEIRVLTVDGDEDKAFGRHRADITTIECGRDVIYGNGGTVTLPTQFDASDNDVYTFNTKVGVLNPINKNIIDITKMIFKMVDRNAYGGYFVDECIKTVDNKWTYGDDKTSLESYQTRLYPVGVYDCNCESITLSHHNINKVVTSACSIRTNSCDCNYVQVGDKIISHNLLKEVLDAKDVFNVLSTINIVPTKDHEVDSVNVISPNKLHKYLELRM